MTTYTVAFIGSSSSGKTSLIRSSRIGLHNLAPTTTPTFESGPVLDSYGKEERLQVNIWELDEGISPTPIFPYIKEKTISYLCLDLTWEDDKIGSEVSKWVGRIESAGLDPKNIVLLGTKADLVRDEDLVKKKQLLEGLATQHKCFRTVYITDCSNKKSHSISIKDVFIETAPDDIKKIINAPLKLTRIIPIYRHETVHDWMLCWQYIFNRPRIKAVDREINLSATAYKIQLKIKALLDFRNGIRDVKIDESRFDDIKVQILALIEARIEKIDSTLGVFKNKSPEKIKAWLSLYEKLYLESNTNAFRLIIEGWQDEKQTRDGEEITNSKIIKEQRSKFKLFEKDVSKSSTILSDIIDLLPSPAHQNQPPV